MSDNLCGPSAPTKGLVGHLDRDRSLQQDRVTGSPASAAGVSRSERRLSRWVKLTYLYSLFDQLPRRQQARLLQMLLLPTSPLPRPSPMLPLLARPMLHQKSPPHTARSICCQATVKALATPGTVLRTNWNLRTMLTRPFLHVVVEWIISAQVQQL